MKSPHIQRSDDQAREETEKFIAKYSGHPGTDRAAAGTPSTAGESSH